MLGHFMFHDVHFGSCQVLYVSIWRNVFHPKECPDEVFDLHGTRNGCFGGVELKCCPFRLESTNQNLDFLVATDTRCDQTGLVFLEIGFFLVRKDESNKDSYHDIAEVFFHFVLGSGVLD